MLKFSRDKHEGSHPEKTSLSTKCIPTKDMSWEGGEKSLFSDPGSEFLLRREREKSAKIADGMSENEYSVNGSSHPDYQLSLPVDVAITASRLLAVVLC